ncbi:uncharacterized protein KNAG_0H00590 [Huiozyma naganishii CBS 8797]|uniref:Eisosome protein 1 n=1 Tax=Huiozyma naganishii (strain ATCC MYA-139 / BCRC 22969 / CBS 8797 / KCTC 17520 / NBRC 10181 / NCYC 3082 / Yp74L-3) TaxID=1071383 RepID=J7R9F6_HUIN7|nr:hypothetical protein KNAG_0H00590 [Kazachstania naganishii CBS 8797]CCK71475.1 hypothetical protein KNAG_0H00590 [Kazachstania naganishii CBS 8797]
MSLVSAVPNVRKNALEEGTVQGSVKVEKFEAAVAAQKLSAEQTKIVTTTTTTVRAKRSKSTPDKHDDDHQAVPRSMRSAASSQLQSYQKPGAPLSKEALYKVKMKYGVYDSPATKRNSGGLDSFPSVGYAANSAVQDSVMMGRYEQQMDLNRDAISAAQSLSKVLITEESLLDFGNEADSAKKDRDYLYSHNSAAAVYKNAPDIILRTFETPENPDVRKQMNLSKVLTGAERKANNRIKKRYVDESPEMIIKRNENALSAAYAVHPSERLPEHFSAEERHRRDLEKQKLEIVKHMTSDKVWKLAQEKTEKRLREQTELYDSETLVYGNMDYNRAAVKVAINNLKKSHLAESKLLEKTQGRINIGKDVWLKNNDIDDLARDLVKPILKEVDERATAQRKIDVLIDKRIEAYTQSWNDWKSLQLTRNKNDIELVERIKKSQSYEKSELNSSNEQKYNAMVSEMDSKISAKKQELAKVQKRRAELSTKLQQELVATVTEQKKRLSSWMLVQQQGLISAKNEETKMLQPYLNDLQVSETTDSRLRSDIEAIKIEMRDVQNEIQLHDNNIINLENDLQLLISGTERGDVASDEHRSMLSFKSKTKKEQMSKERHESQVKALKGRKSDEVKALDSSRAKLASLEKQLAANEKELGVNTARLTKNRDVVRKFKSLQQSDSAAEKYGNKDDLDQSVNRAISSVGFVSNIDDVSSLSEESSLTHSLADVGEVMQAERAQNMGRPTMVNAADDSPVEGSASDAAPSASARSVTGVSGIVGAPAENLSARAKPVQSSPTRLPHKNSPNQEKFSKPPKVSKNKRWMEHFFLGSNANRRNPANTRHYSKPNVTSPLVQQPPIQARTSVEEMQTRVSTPSFTGFSQGSIENDNEVRGLSGVVEGVSQKNVTIADTTEHPVAPKDVEGKRDSLFKEVF